jgi:hypothetical protein
MRKRRPFRALYLALIVAAIAGSASSAFAQTAKKKKAPPPPSFIEENLARIGAPGTEILGWILIGAGVALGAGLFTARNLPPRRLQLGKPKPATVQRITAVAHRALELHAKQQQGLSRDDIADLQSFYERWLNLGTDQREYFRDTLKREGIDLAKIGDAIRFALTARA